MRTWVPMVSAKSPDRCDPRYQTSAAPAANPRGFTLFELVIVVAIVGILAAIVVPRLGRTIDRFRLEAAADRIVADLAHARKRARIKSESLTVTFEIASNKYSLLGMQDADHSTQAHKVKLGESPYEANFVSASLGGDAQIIFDGYGVPDSGGTIVIANRNGEKRTIVVDADTGKASVQ